MSEEENKSENIGEELRRLGSNLYDILKTAWESSEHQNIENELTKGLNDLENSIRNAAQDFSKTETGQQIKENVEEIGRRIRSSDVEDIIHSDLLSVLNKINSELEKAPARWQSGKDQTDQHPNSTNK